MRKIFVLLFVFVSIIGNVSAQAVNGFHLKFPQKNLPLVIDTYVWDKPMLPALSNDDYVKFIKGKFPNELDFNYKAYPFARVKLGSYSGIIVCLVGELLGGKEYYLFVYSATGEYVRSQFIGSYDSPELFQTVSIEPDLTIKCFKRTVNDGKTEFFKIHFKMDGNAGYIKEILNQKVD